MRKSNCVHCVRGVIFSTASIFVTARVGWVCAIDEYDDKQCRCGKNYCNYYKAKPKQETKKEGETNDK